MLYSRASATCAMDLARLSAAVCLLIVGIWAADNNHTPCPHPYGKGDEEPPLCTVANASSIPVGLTTKSILLERVKPPAYDDYRFTDMGSDPKSKAFIDMSIWSTGDQAIPVNVILQAASGADNQYRIFVVRSGDKQRYVWLSGNGGGDNNNGAWCQIGLDLALDGFRNSPQYVYQWGKIPPGRCW